MSVSEIHALIALLDDPDEAVYHHVRERLLGRGREILPFLEDPQGTDGHCALFQSRIHSLRSELERTDIRSAVCHWMEEEDQKLWGGVLLLHRAMSPDQDSMDVQKKFETLRRDIWLELNDELTALEQVRIINHMLFTVLQMESVRQVPHLAVDAIPTAVLENKKGNPLGMGVLYLAISEALGLPVRGVRLPNHFILCYCDDAHVQDHMEMDQSGILFYINPFSGGAVIGPLEVSEFLSHMEVGDTARQWKPSSNQEIMQRLVSNVLFALKEEGRLDEMDEIQKAFEPLMLTFHNAKDGSQNHSSIG